MIGGKCQSVGNGLVSMLLLVLLPVSSALAGVTFVVDDDWNDGLRARFVVTNDTATPLDNWVVRLDLPEHSIEAIWNAKILEQLQGSFVLKPGPWNKVLAPGESTEIGVVIVPGGMEGVPKNMMVK